MGIKVFASATVAAERLTLAQHVAREATWLEGSRMSAQNCTFENNAYDVYITRQGASNGPPGEFFTDTPEPRVRQRMAPNDPNGDVLPLQSAPSKVFMGPDDAAFTSLRQRVDCALGEQLLTPPGFPEASGTGSACAREEPGGSNAAAGRKSSNASTGADDESGGSNTGAIVGAAVAAVVVALVAAAICILIAWRRRRQRQQQRLSDAASKAHTQDAPTSAHHTGSGSLRAPLAASTHHVSSSAVARHESLHTESERSASDANRPTVSPLVSLGAASMQGQPSSEEPSAKASTLAHTRSTAYSSAQSDLLLRQRIAPLPSGAASTVASSTFTTVLPATLMQPRERDMVSTALLNMAERRPVQLFAGRYQLLQEQHHGSQAVVQFARDETSLRQYAIKVFCSRADFEAEVAQYRDPVLSLCLPDLLYADDNATGSVQSATGWHFPSFLVIERGCAASCTKCNALCFKRFRSCCVYQSCSRPAPQCR